jgi:hypothetical protein
MVNVLVSPVQSITVASSIVQTSTSVTLMNTIPANIVVSSKKPIRITANTSGEVIQTSTPVTLKNTTALSNVTRLDSLADVLEPASPEDGSTLIYNAATDTYEVKRVTEVQGNLNGGTF